MTYSIRDIVILTAYSALLLSPIPLLNLALFVASIAAMIEVVFVFALLSIRKLRGLKGAMNWLRFSLPIVLIPVTWVMLLYPASVGRGYVPLDSGTAMLIGGAGACIPFMFNLNSRRIDLDAELLSIGLWTFWAAVASSGLCHIAWLRLSRNFDMPVDLWRLPVLIGVLVSVLTTWVLTGGQFRTKPRYE